MDDKQSKALSRGAFADREAVRQGLDHEDGRRRDQGHRHRVTGSLGLDLALGVGGLPRGRVVEIYGPESSARPPSTLQVIAEMQKVGGTAPSSTRRTRSTSVRRKLGVKTRILLISQPDTGEQALEIADMLVRSGAVDVIVIDSVAASRPRRDRGRDGERRWVCRRA